MLMQMQKDLFKKRGCFFKKIPAIMFFLLCTGFTQEEDMPQKKDSQLVTIGIVQLPFFADQKKNLQNTLKLTEEAAQKGAQIICLPELCQTVYFPQDENAPKQDFAHTIPGPVTDAFAKIAIQYAVVIIVPLYEKDEKKSIYYNSAAVIDADGKLLNTYHKVHIPHDPCFYEKNYFKKGNSYKIYKTRFADFAVLICYDQWFPEAARSVTLQGAQLIFYPTAIGNIVDFIPEEGEWSNAWETVMRGHAIANSVPIAAINRIGRENNLQFWGHSFICDAFGKILKKADAQSTQVLTCQLDLSQNAIIRKEWGFFDNRRPDTYSEIVQ